MTPAFAIGLLLALAALLGSARLLWKLRHAGPSRPRAWRVAALLFAQLAAAALLWCTLFPPPVRTAHGTLTVLTPGAAQARLPRDPGRLLALPEASSADARGATRVPDLATALRRYPGSTRLQVVGMGLPARDRDAVAGRGLAFFPAPLPAGLVALDPPGRVVAGRGFVVRGTAHGLAGGSAELRDPAGRRVERAVLAGDGSFVLHGSARSAGPALWRVLLRDGNGRAAGDAAPLALDVAPARTLRVLMLAGAPNPEFKFLHRWAADAGMQLDTRIDLGAGIRVGGATLDAGALQRSDLLVADLRAWRGLGAGQRASVLAAVDAGMGLMLRATAADGADAATLRGLGFGTAAGAPREVRLGDGFVRAGDAVDALPVLTATVRALAARDGVVALQDAAGAPLSAWRARGRGRVGVAAFDGSYRLVLAGRGDAHAESWSRVFEAVARPAPPGAAPPTIDAAAPGQRSVVCGVQAGARVFAPDGRATTLQPDPRSGSARCAAFWAGQPGWHAVLAGGATTPFHVASQPGIEARATHDATLALVTSASSQADASGRQPGPRWPWFLAWLLLTAGTWWLERSRAGLHARSP